MFKFTAIEPFHDQGHKAGGGLQAGNSRKPAESRDGGRVLHLSVEDWRMADWGLFVRGGKGRKDRVALIGPTMTRALKVWLARHPVPSPEPFLFCDGQGQPLK